MRKTIFFVFFLLGYHTMYSQNVGINTIVPLAMLHVKDSNVLFAGPNPFVNYAPAANPPVQGTGTRLMWYAQKGALRAGWVEDNRWDKDSIGIFSIALGHSALASYTGSVAMGIRTQSRNFASTALGYNTEANGEYSFAVGYESKATAQIATAIGAANIASGFFSTAIGSNNAATGTSAVAIGESATASGVEAIAIGAHIKAKARASFVTGWYNDTTDAPDPVFVSPTDRLFQVGNGNGFFATRSNALTILRNGNHGLGTVNPVARLQVADSNVLFTGPIFISPSNHPNPPVSGIGTRMLWYPQKAVIRAGSVIGNQWDKDSMGLFSAAFGNSTTARGESSFAMGSLSAATATGAVVFGVRSNASGTGAVAMGIDVKATGERSFATGDQSVASGNNSIAMGQNSTASGDRSVAMGYVNNASGFASTAFGFGAIASGNYSVSIGSNTIASGGASISMGDNARAVGNFSNSIGYYTRSKSDYSFVTGKYNDTTATNCLFEVGNGTADNARRNAFTILQNSKTGINTNTPLAMLHVQDSSVLFVNANGPLPASPAPTPVSGVGYRTFWYADKASFRTGGVSNNSWDRDNIGIASFAAGFSTQASGNTSTAMGNFAFATGDIATAMGNSVFAKAKASFAIGTFNDISDNPNGGVEATTDRIFQIGNGADNLTRRNAVTVLRNGNMGIGTNNPVKPLSFPATLGEKILLYPGGAGEVGIGVYGNELRLHCDNPGSMVSFGTQDNAGVFTQAGRFQINAPYALYVNGNIWANGTTYASDARFKEDITPITSPLQKLLQIDGVEYKMKAGAFPKNNFSNQKQIGLLAQNVEKIIPEAVNEIDGYKGVDYARLVPLLIESIKEQQKQIEELKAKINAIENK